MASDRIGAVAVTGGTGALGRAVVQALVKAGGHVAIPWRDERAWQALQADLGGSRLFGQRTDLTDPSQVQGFMDAAALALGRLDGLVCVAGGFTGSGPLELAPLGEWDSMIQGNLKTTWAACRAALPHLLLSHGAIVTVSSRQVATGGAGAATYATSKAGVEALTRAIAQENRGRGVRANCVAPGTLDTAANRQAMPETDTATWTSPASVAEVILFLLSDRSATMTGAVLPVDRAT